MDRLALLKGSYLVYNLNFIPYKVQLSRLLSRTSVAAKKTRKTALSPEALNHANRLGIAIRKARLARGYSQIDFAERARIGLMTLKRIEDGDPHVRLANWLAALDVAAILHLLSNVEDPNADARGVAQRALDERQRAGSRRTTSKDNDFDF
jgi:transcriptional regulator with XRE-family HTH domain